MTLKYLKSLSLVFALLAFAACSSSDTAEEDSGGDGALTTAEEAQVEAAATSTVTSAITGLTSASTGTGFQAVALDSCTASSSISGDISFEETATDATITFTDYDYLLGSCADTAVECIDDCADADFTLLLNTFTNGGITIASDDDSFSMTFDDLSTRTNYAGEESTVEMAGTISGTYAAPLYSITWTDFTSSVEGDADTADVSINGDLTYNEDTGLINGEFVVTINGDDVTCTFVDYSVSSTTPPTCEI